MEYPGDLIMRPGRQACKAGEWVDAVLVKPNRDDDFFNNGLWVCGRIVEIKGQEALVETTGGIWSYPTDKLEINHSQEPMTHMQYLWALLTLQERIRDGLRLSAYDCTATGAKVTYCSWGFHSDNDAPQDIPGMWPIGMPCRQKHQPCPLAILPQSARGWRGCFYRCAAFQRRQELTKELAVSLYNDAIEKARLLIKNSGGDVSPRNN